MWRCALACAVHTFSPRRDTVFTLNTPEYIMSHKEIGLWQGNRRRVSIYMRSVLKLLNFSFAFIEFGWQERSPPATDRRRSAHGRAHRRRGANQVLVLNVSVCEIFWGILSLSTLSMFLHGDHDFLLAGLSSHSRECKNAGRRKWWDRGAATRFQCMHSPCFLLSPAQAAFWSEKVE